MHANVPVHRVARFCTCPSVHGDCLCLSQYLYPWWAALLKKTTPVITLPDETGISPAPPPLQICWKWRKVMTAEPQKGTFRAFLDSVQYSRTGILRYERIFGPGFVSTGGLETTKVCLQLCPCSSEHWQPADTMTDQPRSGGLGRPEELMKHSLRNKQRISVGI